MAFPHPKIDGTAHLHEVCSGVATVIFSCSPTRQLWIAAYHPQAKASFYDTAQRRVFLERSLNSRAEKLEVTTLANM